MAQAAIDKKKLEQLIDRFPAEKSSVIHMLQAIQEEFGYVPEKSMKTMAEKLSLPLAKIYGVASFYSQIYLKPRGKNIIKVCKGTACHVRGAQLIEDEYARKLGIEAGQTTEDLEYTLEAVNCVGACGMAPVIVIGEQYHGNVKPDKATKLLQKSGKKN